MGFFLFLSLTTVSAFSADIGLKPIDIDLPSLVNMEVWYIKSFLSVMCL